MWKQFLLSTFYLIGIGTAKGDSCSDIDPLLKACNDDGAYCCVAALEPPAGGWNGELGLVGKQVVGSCAVRKERAPFVLPLKQDVDVNHEISTRALNRNIVDGLNSNRLSSQSTRELDTPQDSRILRVSNEALYAKVDSDMDTKAPGPWEEFKDMARDKAIDTLWDMLLEELCKALYGEDYCEATANHFTFSLSYDDALSACVKSESNYQAKMKCFTAVGMLAALYRTMALEDLGAVTCTVPEAFWYDDYDGSVKLWVSPRENGLGDIIVARCVVDDGISRGAVCEEDGNWHIYDDTCDVSQCYNNVPSSSWGCPSDGIYWESEDRPGTIYARLEGCEQGKEFGDTCAVRCINNPDVTATAVCQCDPFGGTWQWNAFLSERCLSCPADYSDCSELPYWADGADNTIVKSSGYCDTAPGSICAVECSSSGVGVGTATCACDGHYQLDTSALATCGWSDAGATGIDGPTPAPTAALSGRGNSTEPKEKQKWYEESYGGEPVWLWIAIGGGTALVLLILAKCCKCK